MRSKFLQLEVGVWYGQGMIRAVLLDVDGTLIDSNDAHARAWLEAFREEKMDADYETVRAHIGMGGDHLLPAVLGLCKDTKTGERISRRRGEIFRSRFLPRLRAFPGARAMVESLLKRGMKLVVATSSPASDLKGLLRQAGVDDLLNEYTTADDADRSKPDPDIVKAALEKSGVDAREAVMIGDTPYDIEAALKAGVRVIAFTCGGWPAEKLKGAWRIYAGPWEFQAADLGQHLTRPTFLKTI